MDIVVALATYYKEECVRSKLALESIQKLRNESYGVIIVDEGSYCEFIDQIKKLGAKVYSIKKENLREAKRESFLRAYESGNEFIVCMEPEKVDFVRSISGLIETMKNKNIDLVVPERKSLDICPKFQKNTEEKLNLFCKEITGWDRDFSFGPLIWRRDCTKYFLNFKSQVEEANWDILFIPPLLAKEDGKKIKQIKIDFNYAKEMVEEEEDSLNFNQKRLFQLKIMCEAMQALKSPKLL
mgnify:FL=1